MLIFDDGENCYLESNYLEDIHDDQKKTTEIWLVSQGIQCWLPEFWSCYEDEYDRSMMYRVQPAFIFPSQADGYSTLQ